jgi:hypothetical protein
VIYFLVQFSYIGFIEFYGLFALNRLGMNALTTAGLWLLGGLLVIIIDGFIVGRLVRRFKDRWLVLVGLGLLGAGLILASLTPGVPVIWYSRAEIVEELSFIVSTADELSLVPELLVDLPSDGATGWLGFGWFLSALVLIMTGASLLIPAIKSMLMGGVENYQTSGIFFISSILYKSALVIVPLALGFAIWWYGFTWPFLVEGLILVILLVFVIRLMKSGT